MEKDYHKKLAAFITELRQAGVEIGTPIAHGKEFIYPIDIASCPDDLLDKLIDFAENAQDLND
jgi:hypothetical protein